MIVEARQRGEARRIVTLAHQVALMSRQNKLQSLDEYLRPLRQPRRRGDGSEAVADLLDRKIAKQARAQERTKKGAE